MSSGLGTSFNVVSFDGTQIYQNVAANGGSIQYNSSTIGMQYKMSGLFNYTCPGPIKLIIISTSYAGVAYDNKMVLFALPGSFYCSTFSWITYNQYGYSSVINYASNCDWMIGLLNAGKYTTTSGGFSTPVTFTESSTSGTFTLSNDLKSISLNYTLAYSYQDKATESITLLY